MERWRGGDGQRAGRAGGRVQVRVCLHAASGVARVCGIYCVRAHCSPSLLTAHCALLTAHCSLLTAHCSLLTAHCMVSVCSGCCSEAAEWIQTMKYSPDGSVLAVGSHDNFVYLHNTQDGYSLTAKCSGHSSYITHVDFSADGTVLQSTCGAYELLFWSVADGEQITSASSLRDTEWATWTCTLGWPVQGIWPELADGTDINAVARSASGNTLVTSDDFGMVF